MEANNFIANLKADGTENDTYNLKKVFDEYKTILCKLQVKDRGQFSLNVLSIICRNLDKVPSWRERIDIQDLLVLTIECIRETRTLDRAERIKVLVANYHIHRHVVKQKTPPTSLVLKLSFMPFEVDSKYLLQEYHKVYWSIFTDRISYMERIKSKINIRKITEDILKIIEIYEPIEFCSKNLVFIVHKFSSIYNDNAKDFSQMIRQMFTQLSKTNLEPLKKLPENQILDIYGKLNQCICKIAENALKIDIKETLDVILRTCVTIVGHNIDIYRCQTTYMNTMCSIFTPNTNLKYIETTFTAMLQALEMTERTGNIKAMRPTCPYVQQLLRMYIEHNIQYSSSMRWPKNFSIEVQENCLKLVLHFMKKMRNCEQISVCGDCKVRSGLHDSLRLSKLVKHFINISLSQKMTVTSILPLCYAILIEQNKVLSELSVLGCSNIEKIFRALQTDVHNTAISLNKAQCYENSMKFFDFYLKNELKSEEIDRRNISRGLYNKGICELDAKLYEDALIDAFLSLIFALPDALDCDKNMSLVIDIKAKELKSKNNQDLDETERDALQLVSVYDACKMATVKNMYENLVPHLTDLKFTVLLKHEYSMYRRLWPSLAPVGGVWRALRALLDGPHHPLPTVEDRDVVLEALLEVVVETPLVVRTIHSQHYAGTVDHLINMLDNYKKLTTDMKLVRVALLCLRFEYDMADSSHKYNWKITDTIQTGDPDQVPANRTIPQEHAATQRAILAVRLLAELLPEIKQASRKYLECSLKLFEICAVHLLHLCRHIEALQMTYTCCLVADVLDDDEAYILNVGTLLNTLPPSPALDRIVTAAAEKWRRLDAYTETSIIFLCDSALHYAHCGQNGKAARLVKTAQERVLKAYESDPDINMYVGVGRVLEAQAGVGALTAGALCAANCAQRHYLAAAGSDLKWCARRLRQLACRARLALSSARAVGAARRTRLWRRARAAAAPALKGAPAARAALLYTDVTDTSTADDAQIKIDNRLKHFLGLQPSNETQPYCATDTKQTPFTPTEDLETMRDNMVLKKTQASPSLPCLTVQPFKIPDFFKHSSICTCYACEIPICMILACKISSLEASMYAKSKEKDIADNYFDRVLNIFALAEKKLKELPKRYRMFEKFLADSVIDLYERERKEAYIETLVELAFFQLQNNDFELADEYIVTIHEMVKDVSTDKYRMNDIQNLMVTAAEMKNKKSIPMVEIEFEGLRISPSEEPPKTPVNKVKPPAAAKIVVKDEEIPKQRKVIKLNLDENSSDEKDFEKPTRVTRKKSEFKMPMVTKACLEMATPTSKQKSVSDVLASHNKSDKSEFFTPQATPEAFFTPMTSVKTYSKKTLRSNIVKNLEMEFNTPGSSRKETGERREKEKEKQNEKENERQSEKENKRLKEETGVIKRNVLNTQKCVKKDSLNVPQKHTLNVSQKDTLNVPQKHTLNVSQKDTLNVPQKSSNSVLKRATSPGTLRRDARECRQRRLRQPVNFSVEHEDK